MYERQKRIKVKLVRAIMLVIALLAFFTILNLLR
jgi:hypothetical protein